ncbi:hypothetical protein ACFQL1_14820 [Halomicroarcula sp. GCM10025709]|uniref:hypothetical protein n=1 Tax=Halomicroarcula sp. GCM10025709 TaxID=3252669 RepID=UPI00361505A5
MSLTLLHYSDVETALDDPQQCARLAGAIDARRDGDTVVVGTGDNTAPGALPLATDGRVALEFFAAVAPDVDTFGNHDFDFGVDTARELADDAPQTWLCANATVDGERFADAETVPHTVVETDQYRVGVVGVAHPETDEINPAAAPVDFDDPVPAIRESAATLRERGVDFVVVASHCGEETAESPARPTRTPSWAGTSTTCTSRRSRTPSSSGRAVPPGTSRRFGWGRTPT